EYIPDGTEEEPVSVLLANEGNFKLDIRFADFGEGDLLPESHSLNDSLAARHLEPETNIFKVDDDMYVYATLAVDPVDKTPRVTTRAFTDSARIRVVAYDSISATTFNPVFDAFYRVGSGGTLVREGSTDLINLPGGHYYKLIAYSYNDTTTAYPPHAPVIADIDPVHDLIWGQSEKAELVSDGPVVTIYITMSHKLSQVKLVAISRDASKPISEFSGVSMPGYEVDLTTLTGALTPKTAISQGFTFTGIPSDSINSNTRTVYTGTPGDIPTIINVGKMTVDGDTYEGIPATFAKQLRSGFSYTMTMRIGDSPEITDNNPPGFTPYVGAFWRSDQIGERLIRLPRLTNGLIDSVWTAHVIEGKNWIMLDKVMTTDDNVGWRTDVTPNESSVDDAATFDSDPDRLVTSDTVFVAGFVRNPSDPAFQAGVNDHIYFRIGLKGTIPSDSVRYGMVLLTYGNNRYRQRIWIRQGEEDDYLMRPQDMGGTESWGSPDPRPLARKFSPFNLTVVKLNSVADIPGTLPPVNPGIFTTYPSQAGAFFQWANPVNPRVAWSAYEPTVTFPAWNGNVIIDFWDNLKATHETCPPGYRRPGDGPTSAYDTPFGVALQSETIQSLLFNSTEHTYSAGYYADGFFDRRQIVAAPTATTPGSVSIANEKIAHKGLVIYNPLNNASLFLPMAGLRAQTGGVLNNLSGFVWYQTNATSSSNNTVKLSYISTLGMSTSVGGTGASIRCIVDDDNPVPATIEGAITTYTNVMYDFQHQTIEAYVTGAETATAYQWQVSSDGGLTFSNLTGTDATNDNFFTVPQYMIHSYAPTVDSLSFRLMRTHPGGPVPSPTMHIYFIRVTDGTGTPVGNYYGFDPGIGYYLTLFKGEDGNMPGTTIKVPLLNLGQSEGDDAGDLGDLYQWGRIPDGHEKIVWVKDAASNNAFGPGTSATVVKGNPTYVDGQIPSSSSTHYGRFILPNASPPWDWSDIATSHNRWGDGSNYATRVSDTPLVLWSFPKNNPCPPGWKVPSKWQWWDIYAGNGSNLITAPTAYPGSDNVWRFRYGANNAVGGAIVANPRSGEELYLPNAGRRSSADGTINPSRIAGSYWSSVYADNVDAEPSDTYSFAEYFVFDNIQVYAGNIALNKLVGAPVRCIEDKPSSEIQFSVNRESWVDDPSQPGTTYFDSPNKLMAKGNTVSHKPNIPNIHYSTAAGGTDGAAASNYGTFGEIDGNTSGTPLNYLVQTDRIYVSSVGTGTTFQWAKGSHTVATFPTGTATTFNPSAGGGILISDAAGNGNGIYTIYATDGIHAAVHTIKVTNFRDGLSTARPKLIQNRQALTQLDNDATAMTRHYELYNNIALGPSAWPVLGGTTLNFTGSLYGNYYTLDGLTVTSPTTDAGLFRYLDANGKVEALGMTNVNINVTGDISAGAIAGSMSCSNATIADCYSMGNITIAGATTSTKGAGGLVGLISANSGSPGSTIIRSWSSVNVTDNYDIGGLVGHLNATTASPVSISECYSTGILRSANSIGGIVGFCINGNIKDCYSTGEAILITGPALIAVGRGGIAGYINPTTVTNCFSTAKMNTGDGIVGTIGSTTGTVISNNVALNPFVAGVPIANSGGTQNNNHVYEGISVNGTPWASADWTYTTATTLTSYTGIGWSGATWRMKTSAEISSSGIDANVPILNNLDPRLQPPHILSPPQQIVFYSEREDDEIELRMDDSTTSNLAVIGMNNNHFTTDDDSPYNESSQVTPNGVTPYTPTANQTVTGMQIRIEAHDDEEFDDDDGPVKLILRVFEVPTGTSSYRPLPDVLEIVPQIDDYLEEGDVYEPVLTGLNIQLSAGRQYLVGIYVKAIGGPVDSNLTELYFRATLLVK
ncbi:MAG: hypothetical protein LBE56_08180, partial [Tannerella sp.]|nr:hypothetical protein [Tannerella sp.]